MCLLDAVDHVVATVRERDHLGPAGLGLQQERGEILGVRAWIADRPDDLAARAGHEPGCRVQQRTAAGIVGRDDEPSGAARHHDRTADGMGDGIGVEGPVHSVGRACRARQVAQSRAGGQQHLILVPGDRAAGQRHRAVAHVRDRVHPVAVEPLPGDGHPGVWLVLVVRGDDLHGDVRIGRHELPCGQGGTGHAARSRRVPQRSRQVRQHADADRLRRIGTPVSAQGGGGTAYSSPRLAMSAMVASSRNPATRSSTPPGASPRRRRRLRGRRRRRAPGR